MDPIEAMLAMLANARSWPIASETRLREKLALWIALRESDERVLKAAHRWPNDRLYVLDNLAQKIAEAYGSLMWGEDPTVKATQEADQARLTDSLWQGNSVPSGLQSAEETCVSEGEVWYRISTHPLVAHPVLTWHSRWDVVPMLVGREVVAVAFVSRLPDPAASSSGGRSQIVYRHLEIHGRGRVLNALYRGRAAALGQRVDLARHNRTADMAEQWDHGVDSLLAGRIVNRWGRDPLAGVSIFQGIWRQFLVLNEAASIGRENLRLTAKKRAVVPRSALRPTNPNLTQAGADQGDGTIAQVPKPAVEVDAGEEFFVVDELDVTEGKESSNAPFRVMEYSFDAEALIAFYEHLVTTIAHRCDLVPQFMGRGDFGSGNSGIALRVRLLPTVNAIEGRARYWDDDLPAITRDMQRVDAAPVPAGLAAGWTDPEGIPSIDRDATLPEDPGEQATRISTLRTGQAISIEQAVREQHPDWEKQQIDDEVAAIRADEAATLPATTFGGGGE